MSYEVIEGRFKWMNLQLYPTFCHKLHRSKPKNNDPLALVKWLLRTEQGKSEGFDSCDRPSNLTQIGFESSIFQPMWPLNLMDDPEK